MKTTNLIISCLFIFSFLISCEEKKGQKTAVADSLKTTDTIKVESDTVSTAEDNPKVELKDFNRKFDNVARAISGIKQDQSSALKYIDTTSSWKSFSQSFDSSWAIIEEKRFSKMRAWSNAELSDVNKGNTDVFYPFSGPDILNAFILFPKAKSYSLYALEPIGELPDFSKMTEKQKQEYLLSVEVSLNDLFNKSYFITRNMLKDLQKHKVNGTLPLMCVFLKRTGNTIVDIKKVGIDTSGTIFERTDSTKFKGSRGVRVDFIAPNTKEVRSVYYFKCDLADSGIEANKGLKKYLSNLPTVHTYLKSASYLLHYKEFATVRNTIFEKSDAIVQDDSGIAFHYFDKEKWQIQLYGRYAKPVKDFPHIKEPDLEKAYKTDSIKDLPFDLGYHWGTKQNNMLKATLKK